MYSEKEKEEAKKCPIDAILRHAGRNVRGLRIHKEIMFFSPFRDENNPSFAWNTVDNTWKDFGDPTGKYSGDAINLVEYLYGVKYLQALRIISEIQYPGNNRMFVPLVKERDTDSYRPSLTTEIISVGPIIDRRCKDYLASRGIPESVFSVYLYEIHYRVGNEYIGIGLPTDNGGYVVRGLPDPSSKKFPKGIKRFIGQSGISTFRMTPGHNSEDCLVFEGLMNMVSYVALYGAPNNDIIVLNTAGNAKFLRGIAGAGVKKLSCYLDNDNEGKNATSILREISGCQVLDLSNLYARYDFNDLNDLLMKK